MDCEVGGSGGGSGRRRRRRLVNCYLLYMVLECFVQNHQFTQKGRYILLWCA